MTTHDSELKAFLESRAEAQQSKDIDRLMRHYDSGIVYYDAVPPLQFSGTEQVRRNFQRWFDGYEGPISLQNHDLTLATSGELAFANMLHLDTGTRTNGLQSSIWVRETVCLRLSDVGWLITHEHVSIPINPENLQAWLPSEKDQAA
ncbi:YybH family protein [Nocardia sp. CA-151230]|uniref:YybH family protein n=1 Tax=Nocardia sp. CA-151230 TaxID=3239982 RepID=UPI003D8FAD5D